MPHPLALSPPAADQVPDHGSPDQGNRDEGEGAIHPQNDMTDLVPFLADERAEYGDATVPDGRSDAHGDQGPERAQVYQAGERRDNGTDAGKESADEDPDDAEAEVL